MNDARSRALAGARIDLDDAATLLCKNRSAIEQMIQDGRLRTVPNPRGGVAVRLEDVVKIRHEGWQAIRELALGFIGALEDEMLEELLDDWEQRKRVDKPKKTWNPTEPLKPKRGRPQEAN